VGGLGALGLSLPNAVSAAPASGGAFGKAKSCIVLFLLGSPQHETWDSKPGPSADIRGQFWRNSVLSL
jgi:hypothetical protein